MARPSLSTCPICRQTTDPDVLAKTRQQTVQTVQAQVWADFPDWSPQDGLCPTCAQEYACQHAQTRSPESLHTSTCPHGTFPYYHPAEETVLAQTERLASHGQFNGRGITIAFLDSGYYPHPDLLDEEAATVRPPNPTDDVGQIRRRLANQPHRIRQYVNIQHGEARASIHAPSLWSDALNSWHGQMSAVLAAGNGFLSKGLHRGYAPQAGAVLIKIGRTSGRIPEEDILAGLRWLLADDNWLRYGVRVLNVSVGGDHPQPWQENPVCLAVEELAHRGVLTVAAAGNSHQPVLMAPAQAPSAITVGGTDDDNRRWFTQDASSQADVRLYHHNWGQVEGDAGPVPKPDMLAPARWLAGPLLPVSPVFREAWAIGLVRQALARRETEQARSLLLDWHTLLDLDVSIAAAPVATMDRALRFRMNPLKWVHPFYQHVDGTSVAAPQVAGVAAQMLEANPNLTPAQIKELLQASALALSGANGERTGSGLLQPTQAVALALRRYGGRRTGLPVSGTRISANRLHKWPFASTVEPQTDGPAIPIYFGFSAPRASQVSVVGSFNGWQPAQHRLHRADEQPDWWHGLIMLPPGQHSYRFWTVDRASEQTDWLPDPENPTRQESGFARPHSFLEIQ